MIKSIIVCKHGNLGFSASLRFDDSKNDKELSANNKYSLYKNIDYIVRQDSKRVKNEDKLED